MSMFLQLGHESWSLLDESDDGGYAGIVLSPVNDAPAYIVERLARLGNRRGQFEVVLDPQLYNPASQRGRLGEWKFYSSDFETADRSDLDWWSSRAIEIVSEALQMNADAVCSPAFLSTAFTNDYYRFVVDIADQTRSIATDAGLSTLLTAIVPLRELENPRRAMEIASVLSGASCDRVYLTFLADDIPQRQPLRDMSALASAVHLIKLLSQHFRVHVAFCGHDLVLWKSAGATDISSGKWMNVRRFSPARWQEDDSAGRNVSYWNDESLMTLIRDQEVLRLDRQGWFGSLDASENPAAGAILDILRGGQGQPWMRLSWLQYLRWCSNTEVKIRTADVGEQMLMSSDAAWGEVERLRMLFTDRFNDGSHVRGWLNSLREGLAR